jgi:cysteine synthase A
MLIKNIEGIIGKTPLLEMGFLSENGCRILAKLEYLNPASSIKDRVALFMIEEGFKSGEIDQNSIIIEPTSGNTGIGLAMVCASKGLRLILTMPESMSLERRSILKYLGAEIELTPKDKGMEGAIERALELKEKYKNSFMPNQFKNRNNPLAHQLTTALEIIDDVDSEIDVFISSIGTGGTITGVGRELKKRFKNIRIIGIEPKNSHIITKGKKGFHKIEGIGAGFIPEVLDLKVIDEVLTISDEEAIFYAQEAGRKAGILSGISSGANLAIAHKLSKNSSNKTIVTILPDTAQRYLSTNLFKNIY